MYKVKIEKVETRERVKEDWEKIADSGNERDGGSVYAYVPHKVSELVTTELLEQLVPDVDLKAVIKAINGI